MKFSPIVAIQGARQTGKSFLARELLAKSHPNSAYVTLDQPTAKNFAEETPESFLEKYSSSTPVIIDEVQKVPPLFDALKYTVDHDRRPGKFVILGSTEFSKKVKIREALTGRLSSIRLFPLTISEALNLESTAVKSCFHISPKPRCDRATLLRHLERGGLPGMFAVHSEREHGQLIKEWIELTIYRDLALIPSVKIDAELAQDILREIAQLLEPTAGHIAKSLKTDLRRIKTHLQCLELLFVIHKLSPIKGSTGKPMYFMCDVGLAHFFEASLERRIHTWLIQETFAAKEWSANLKEQIGFFRSAKSALTHLVIQHSRTDWTAVKIIAKERFSEKDTWSLTKLQERVPSAVHLKLVALTPTTIQFDCVKCVPWESLV